MNASTLVNILLLLIVCISTFPRNVRARTYDDRKFSDQMEMLDDSPSLIDQYELVGNEPPVEVDSISNKRRADSAEKYFDWASKANRPMEYWRGKRFWLFTKKEEQGNQQESIPHANTPVSSFRQGIWRSGIVGRRRR